MDKLKQHMKLIVATGCFALLTIVMLGTFIFHKESEPVINTNPLPLPKERDSEKEKKQSVNVEAVIMIDVQGSVKNPGVYQMKEGARVIHAIKKAGGFLEEAEVRSINQAQKISDEMIIYVAAKGEELDLPVQNQQTPNGSKININSADAMELQQLSGVGPAKAESIIAYREENGPFTSIEKLLKVRGIGEKTIEEWRDKIVVH